MNLLFTCLTQFCLLMSASIDKRHLLLWQTKLWHRLTHSKISVKFPKVISVCWAKQELKFWILNFPTSNSLLHQGNKLQKYHSITSSKQHKSSICISSRVSTVPAMQVLNTHRILSKTITSSRIDNPLGLNQSLVERKIQWLKSRSPCLKNQNHQLSLLTAT